MMSGRSTRWPIRVRAAGITMVLVLMGTSRVRPWEPASCARAFFQRALKEKGEHRGTTPGAKVRVAAAAIPGVELLPLKVFEAESTETGPPLTGWFVLGDNGTCGLIGGDLDRLTGHAMDRESGMAWGLKEYNRCLDPVKAVVIADGKGRTDYVLAVLSALGAPRRVALVQPSMNGGIEVVGTGERLQGFPNAAVRQVEAPVVRHGDRIDRAILFTWESPPEAIMKNEAYVWSNGKVSLFRERIAPWADEDQVSVAPH